MHKAGDRVKVRPVNGIAQHLWNKEGTISKRKDDERWYVAVDGVGERFFRDSELMQS